MGARQVIAAIAAAYYMYVGYTKTIHDCSVMRGQFTESENKLPSMTQEDGRKKKKVDVKTGNFRNSVKHGHHYFH